MVIHQLSSTQRSSTGGKSTSGRAWGGPRPPADAPRASEQLRAPLGPFRMCGARPPPRPQRAAAGAGLQARSGPPGGPALGGLPPGSGRRPEIGGPGRFNTPGSEGVIKHPKRDMQPSGEGTLGPRPREGHSPPAPAGELDPPCMHVCLRHTHTHGVHPRAHTPMGGPLRGPQLWCTAPPTATAWLSCTALGRTPRAHACVYARACRP